MEDDLFVMEEDVLGRALRAKRSFQPGELVLQEKAFLLMPLTLETPFKIKIKQFLTAPGQPAVYGAEILINCVIKFLQTLPEKRATLLGHFFCQAFEVEVQNQVHYSLIEKLYTEIQRLLALPQFAAERHLMSTSGTVSTSDILRFYHIIRLNAHNCNATQVDCS